LPVLGDAWRAGERPVVRAVTGAGKAQLISEIAHLMARPGEVVVVSAPRQSLVEQLSGYEDPDPGSVRWRMGDRVGVYYGRRKVIDRDVIVTCNPSLPDLVGALAVSGRKCRALIVDEAHRCETVEFVAAVERLAPKLRVGFSATPWRTAKDESLSLFSREVYTYGLREAIRDRVLVEYDEVGDERGGNNANDVVIDLIRAYAVGPGIVSAKDISDADAYAGTLAAAGIPAASIHSKLPRAEQRARIERLRAGDLRCLVHVALLQEGVDLPWLRWLAMRRPNATAIRYFQELGRVLRASPDKDRALLIDPYNHSEAFGISHESRIGDMEKVLQEEAERPSVACSVCGASYVPSVNERDPYKCPRCRPPGEPVPDEMPVTVAKSQVVMWARRALFVLVDAGIAEVPMNGSSWRAGWPSDRQVETLRRMGGDVLRSVLPHVGTMSRGEVSDLIGLTIAIRQAKRSGRHVPPLPEIPSAAIRSLESRK
jgi:superfamily II DNA or RNA helicase